LAAAPGWLSAVAEFRPPLWAYMISAAMTTALYTLYRHLSFTRPAAPSRPVDMDYATRLLSYHRELFSQDEATLETLKAEAEQQRAEALSHGTDANQLAAGLEDLTTACRTAQEISQHVVGTHYPGATEAIGDLEAAFRSGTRYTHEDFE